MNNTNKTRNLILVVILVIAAGVAGYFIGSGALINQGASLYKTNTRASIKDPNISSTGPTGGDTPMLAGNGDPADVADIVVYLEDGTCVKGNNRKGWTNGTVGRTANGRPFCVLELRVSSGQNNILNSLFKDVDLTKLTLDLKSSSTK